MNFKGDSGSNSGTIPAWAIWDPLPKTMPASFQDPDSPDSLEAIETLLETFNKSLQGSRSFILDVVLASGLAAAYIDKGHWEEVTTPEYANNRYEFSDLQRFLDLCSDVAATLERYLANAAPPKKLCSLFD